MARLNSLVGESYRWISVICRTASASLAVDFLSIQDSFKSLLLNIEDESITPPFLFRTEPTTAYSVGWCVNC